MRVLLLVGIFCLARDLLRGYLRGIQRLFTHSVKAEHNRCYRPAKAFEFEKRNFSMKKGLALEPLDVDLMLDGGDMTPNEREMLSAFIEKNKPDARLKKKLDALLKRLGQLSSEPTWQKLIAVQDIGKKDGLLRPR